jgi:hypothetical protein
MRGGRLARVVRAGAAACALAVLACNPALAQRHGDHGADQRQDQRQDRQDQRILDQRQDPRVQPDPRAQDPRTQDPRTQDPRAMPAAREQRFDSREFDGRQDPRAQEARRPSRLTPDERRDLRRQINEAGMDLYPHQPRH